MMKLLCFLALVAVAYAAQAIFPQEEKPAELACQEGCYLSKLNKVLPYNTPYYPGDECGMYTCQDNNETKYVTCGTKEIPQGCTKSEDDLSKNYPDCCGTEVCPAN